jgi:hypothetical protein
MHITGSYRTKKRNSLKAVTRATTLGFLSHPISYCFLKWTVSDNRNWRATQLFPSNLKVLEKKRSYAQPYLLKNRHTVWSSKKGCVAMSD